MPAQLTITPARGEIFTITIENTATIGRTTENQIALSGDPHASRFHAVIRCHNGTEYQIIDLGSRNGTFVDNRQVVLPSPLTHGSRIRIASSEILFELPVDTSVEEPADTTLGATLMQSVQLQTFPAAILVCDIRGFSTFSEQLPPADVSRFLGQWFRKVGELVRKKNGVIDKFIGDAVLAYWSGQDVQLVCESALITAREMGVSCGELCWPHNNTPMRVGTALHFGQVTSGNVGIVAQRDATIIGDTVNTAFRLEGAMKDLGVSCLCSEAFAENFSHSHGFRDLGPRSLKGKAKPVRVFDVSS